MSWLDTATDATMGTGWKLKWDCFASYQLVLRQHQFWCMAMVFLLSNALISVNKHTLVTYCR